MPSFTFEGLNHDREKRVVEIGRDHVSILLATHDLLPSQADKQTFHFFLNLARKCFNTQAA